MTRRVGLFGGTFDPVHNAHLALANAALDSLQLQQLRWIPTGQPWYRERPQTAPEHRAAMVALAIEHEPRFVLDRIELERPGPGYTLDTVRALEQAEPGTEWLLIIGQDQYARFHTWHGWRELLQRVTLAVANRPGAPADAMPDPEVAAYRHEVIPLPLIPISASELRRRAAAGEDISAMVPPAVARYIDQHGLYRTAAGR